MTDVTDVIDVALERWHAYLRGERPGGLDELLHPDCVFYSPIVFTPQRGRDLTKLYLRAAGQTLGGDSGGDSDRDGDSDGDGVADRDSSGDEASGSGPSGGFRYVKEVAAGNVAILEFETTMGDTHVNGVDIVTCDDDGMIVEFKVMLRPLQAVNAVHAAMRTMLESMAPTDAH